MRKRSLLLSILIVLLTCSGVVCRPAKAQGHMPESPAGLLTHPTSTDEAAITSVLASQDRAWAKGDAAGYTSRALPEVSFTNVVGTFSIGMEPLLAQVESIFSTIYKGSRLKTSLVHVSMIGTDVALVDCTTELRDFVQPPTGAVLVDGAVHTQMQEVMVRKQGKWWIASLHNVLVDPEFSKPAPPK